MINKVVHQKRTGNLGIAPDRVVTPYNAATSSNATNVINLPGFDRRI